MQDRIRSDLAAALQPVSRPARALAALASLLVLLQAPCAAQPAPSSPIAEVLLRSQALRLAAMAPSDPESPRVKTLQASFEKLLQAQAQPLPVTLRVVRNGSLAQTMQGQTIVVQESMADMDERVRLFILAHEIGHVALRHWEQTARLYERWIPDEVQPETTDPVAAALGREASAQAHEQEFAADAYAARLLQGLGVQYADMLLAFQSFGATRATATHPSAGRRLAALRQQLAEQAR